MSNYLQRLYLYALGLALKEAQTDQLRAIVEDCSEYYLISWKIKVPKRDEFEKREMKNI